VYALEDRQGIVLLDTGSSHRDSIAALQLGLAAIGARITDISGILCTHGHYDHYGLATQLSATSGASIALGEHEVGLVRAVADRDLHRHSMQERHRWLRYHGADALVEPTARAEQRRGSIAHAWRLPDQLLRDGDLVELDGRHLQVIGTAGHTRGHVVYFDVCHRLLFAGDHVLPRITPSLGFEPFPDGRALELFLTSLEDVRDLGVDQVLPGHGAEFADLRGRVDALIAHHRERLAICMDVLSDGVPHSAKEVADRLKWTRRDRSFSELDVFNRMLAVMETVTHLEWLVLRGRLRREGNEELRTYAAMG